MLLCDYTSDIKSVEQKENKFWSEKRINVFKNPFFQIMLGFICWSLIKLIYLIYLGFGNPEMILTKDGYFVLFILSWIFVSIHLMRYKNILPLLIYAVIGFIKTHLFIILPVVFATIFYILYIR